MNHRASIIGGSLLVLWAIAWITISGLEARPLSLSLGYLKTTGPNLLAAAGMLVVAWGFGRTFCSRLLVDFGKADALTLTLLEVALGFACLLVPCSLLGSIGLLHPPAAWVLVGLGVVLAARSVHRDSWPGSGFGIPDAAPGSVQPGLLLVLLAAALLFPALLEAGAPPVGSDEYQYHRRFVEQILRTGRLPGDMEDGMSGYALGIHVLAALPTSIAGIGALRPFSMMFGVLGLLAGERLSRRTFGPGASWIYVLVVCGAVSFLRSLPVFNTDLTLSPFVALAVLVALDWARSPGTPGQRPWVLAMLGGTALAIKFTAPLFLAPFYLLLGATILWKASSSARGPALARLVAAALLPVVFALPWLIKNQITSGHPLFPLLGLPLPEEAATAFTFNFIDNYGPGSSLGSTLRAPWDLFVLGREYDRRLFLGRLNVWPLVALPGMLLAARRNRPTLLLFLGTLIGFFLWVAVLRRVVYLNSLWPTLAALTAGGLAGLLPASKQPSRRAFAAILAALLVLSAVSELAPAWSDQLESADVATGKEDLEERLDELHSSHRCLRWISDNVPPDQTVAFFWSAEAGGLPNRVIWVGAEDHTPLRAKLVKFHTPELLLEEMRREGVAWVLYRPPLFLQSSYPDVDKADFEVGFSAPAALSERTLKNHLVLRFSHRGYSVYELLPSPPQSRSETAD